MEKTASVYVLEEYVGFFNNYKVGASTSIKNRIWKMQPGTVGRLTLVYKMDMPTWEEAFDLESAIHRNLEGYRLAGRGREWYRTDLSVIIKTIEKIVNPFN